MMQHISVFRRTALLAVVTFVAAVLSAGSLLAQSSSDPLCVMTYNLRFANSNPAEAWSKRRPLMRKLIRDLSPDVMGTQEGVYGQLKDLASDLPDYEWIGLGRDGGSRGEFMAVFYKKARLEPLSFDHFWLSDTPNLMGSTTWSNTNRRMVTSVKFLDRKTKQEFFFFNTHFDHQIQMAREKSANLVRQRIEELNTPLPLLLVGDFNAAAGTNQAYKILTRDDFLHDTWQTAAKREGDGIGTFNGFRAIQPNGPRIDWILSRGDVTTEKIEIVTFQRDGQFPSDHFPVVAKLRLGAVK